MKLSPSAPCAGGLLHASEQVIAFNSVEQRWAAILIIVGFGLLLTWPGSRD